MISGICEIIDAIYGPDASRSDPDGSLWKRALLSAALPSCTPVMELSTGEAMHARFQLRRRRRSLNRKWRCHALRRH
jgi:hypothetical protein